MRFLSVAVALVMLFSVGAMAQESGAFDVSGGVYLGNHTDLYELKSNALGFYASADASIPGLPVAITGAFATFSPDKSDEGEDFSLKKHTVTVFDLLVGYRVFGDLAVGAGWASYGFKGTVVEKGVGEDEFDLSNGGFAIGAFGKLPLSDGFRASGKLLFVPSSKLKVKDSDNDGLDTNMFGFTVSATYAVNDNFGIEGGYRSLRINFKDHDDVDITTGGFFLGVSYAF
jgi:hypothetical protein